MKIRVNDVSTGVIPPVTGMCPHCGHTSVFQSTRNESHIGGDIYINRALVAGMRICPNDNCNGLIFFIAAFKSGYPIVKIYPENVINFDKANIPEKVLSAFEEAVKCHANECYIASGIMIRKTLEVMCEDRGATGPNLYQRLNNLATSVIIPEELKAGFHELRLLGNDAAHVESQTFNQVGKEEIEVSIEFTKEILKGVYQYESLLSKLRALKRDTSSSPLTS